MPIRKSDYPPNWPSLSLQVRIEAGWQCEWCGAPHGAYIIREQAIEFFTVYIAGVQKKVPYGDFREVGDHLGATKIILTVAHLDRNTDNNDRSNLAALCQRCHLNHDRAAQHIPNRRYGRHHAKAPQTKLFE